MPLTPCLSKSLFSELRNSTFVSDLQLTPSVIKVNWPSLVVTLCYHHGSIDRLSERSSDNSDRLSWMTPASEIAGQSLKPLCWASLLRQKSQYVAVTVWTVSAT